MISATEWLASDWIPIGAALVALISTLFAWRSSSHARRQADAVLGEVTPSFGAYQENYVEYSSQARLQLEIINHNRRALLLHEISFQYPEDVIIFADHEDLRGVIGSILEAIGDGGRVKRFEIPHRIKGCGMNSEPSELVIPLRCGWKHLSTPMAFRFCFKATYRQEGDIETESAFGCVEVIPPQPIDGERS